MRQRRTWPELAHERITHTRLVRQRATLGDHRQVVIVRGSAAPAMLVTTRELAEASQLTMLICAQPSLDQLSLPVR